MLGEKLDAVRCTAPRVHCITNYVTANDCANVLLACGAAPIMADDPGEAEEITALCRGLVLNLGTLKASSLPAMLAAGRKANALGLPVVLDPVGAGASHLRTAAALRLLEEVRFAVIRGNVSEIKALAQGGGATPGVDAAPADRVSEQTLPGIEALARAFARKTGAVAAVTGTIDVVTDGQTAYFVRNGCPEMARITGTGCQLSALIGAFAAASPAQPLQAAAAAVCAMGLCGQLARDRLGPRDGTGSYRNYLLDAVSRLTAAELEQGAKYEVR